MLLEDLLYDVKKDKELAERHLLGSIEVLRRILNRIEDGVKNDCVIADNGLQGNEWKIYKELSNLERLAAFEKQLSALEVVSVVDEDGI